MLLRVNSGGPASVLWSRPTRLGWSGCPSRLVRHPRPSMNRSGCIAIACIRLAPPPASTVRGRSAVKGRTGLQHRTWSNNLGRARARRLTRLLDRQALTDTIRAGDLGHMKAENFDVFFARADSVLIAENGLSLRLEELLAKASTERCPRSQRTLPRSARACRRVDDRGALRKWYRARALSSSRETGT